MGERRPCREFPKLTAAEVGARCQQDGCSDDWIVESQGQNFDVTYGLSATSLAGSALPLQTSLRTTTPAVHTMGQVTGCRSRGMAHSRHRQRSFTHAAIRFQQTLSFVMVLRNGHFDADQGGHF
jgi:hypothetical protein